LSARSGWLGLGILLVALMCAPPAQARWLTAQRLVRAQARRDYRADISVERPAAGLPPERLRVWHASDGRSRVEWLGKNGRVRQVSVSTRHITWRVSATNSRVRVAQADPEPPLEQRIALLERNYRLVVLGQGKALGRAVLLCLWRPKDPDNLTWRMSVDLATALPLLTERLLPDGQVLDRTRFTSLALRLKPRTDAFDPKLPPAGEAHSPIVELQRGTAHNVPTQWAGATIISPSRLGSGYHRYAWRHLKDASGKRLLVQHYHDGLNAVSAFVGTNPLTLTGPAVSVSEGNWQGQAYSRLGETTLVWRHRGLHWALVGHRTPAGLARMAQRLL
jgi:negative regulator of sigma E activity